MLESNTIKALLEAMLFVSDKPVTLRQMTAKVRHVVRKNQPQAQTGVSVSEVSAADIEIEEDARQASDENVETFQTADEGGETATPESVEVSARSEAAVDSDVATDSENEGRDVVPADAVSDADDDGAESARAQLAERQKELEDDVTIEEIKTQLFAIEEDLRSSDRGIELVQVAKGYQLRTKPDISSYLQGDKGAPPMRLSPSSLETLAIVAYEQPAPKHKIEDVRGVDCGGVLKTLLDRDFIRIVGRSDEPGRPLVYGTTAKFLEVFGLSSLKDLPNPSEFQDMAASAEGDVEIVSEAAEKAGAVESDGNVYVHSSDFSDADVELFSESERAILEELDQSLAGLKDVEKGMDLLRKQGETAESPPAPETKN